jgi:rod shape-determining protein MreC
MVVEKHKTLIAVLIVIIFTIIFHYIGWLRPIENFFRSIVSTGSGSLYSFSIHINEKQEYFDDVEVLKNKYRELKQDYLNSKVDDIKLTLILEENKELRKKLNFFENNKNLMHVGANVIGKNIDPVGSTIIIDKGEIFNIKEDQPVIVGDGVLIGKIMKVEKDISIVRLINDSQSKIAATLINKEKSIGMVEGGYDISVRMNFIPQNEIINIGDTVVTSGLESGIMRGLLIGIVESIEKEIYQPFQEAVVTPTADLDHITVVSVLISEE